LTRLEARAMVPPHIQGRKKKCSPGKETKPCAAAVRRGIFLERVLP
jgi:hypothetical protein